MVLDTYVVQDFTWRERLRYRFDNLLGRGPVGMVALLFAATLLFLVTAALVITLLRIRDNDDQTLSFGEALWQSMMRAIDPGTIGEDVPWGFRAISLIITILGIFVVSALIGILASGLDTRLTNLQRGRGRIAESGHTVILGWSPKVFTLVQQLALAKQDSGGGVVAILSDRDKREMDDLLAARVPHRHGTRVVTRSGLPTEPTDVALVRPDLASSIIVVSDENCARDAGVVKAVLSLVGDAGESVPIIAELASQARAKALRSVTSGQVAIVQPTDIVARAAAQSSRETGLNLVLQELLDFEGSEIYFHEVPEARGARFTEVLNGFENSCVLGLRHADGTCAVNPHGDTAVSQNDELILLAENRSSIQWTGTRQTRGSTPQAAHVTRAEMTAEAAVMFGWSDYGAPIVEQLDSYIPAGSHLTVVVDPDLIPAAAVRLPSGLKNLSVDVLEIAESDDPVESVLRSNQCDHVLIICYRVAELTEDEAESRSLTTFLEVRSALERFGRTAHVTAELLDERDVLIVPSAHVGEFMVSEKLASLIMAQLSENIGLQPVFDELLDARGSEIYCKPIELYTTLGVPTSFAELVQTAAASAEVALGWRLANEHNDAARGFGVRVNPPKSASLRFASGDQMLVLAQSEG